MVSWEEKIDYAVLLAGGNSLKSQRVNNTTDDDLQPNNQLHRKNVSEFVTPGNIQKFLPHSNLLAACQTLDTISEN